MTWPPLVHANSGPSCRKGLRGHAFAVPRPVWKKDRLLGITIMHPLTGRTVYGCPKNLSQNMQDGPLACHGAAKVAVLRAVLG